MKADWKNEEWTAFAVKAIKELGPNLLEVKPEDFGSFSKAEFSWLSDDDKIQFYVMLISAMAKRESGFNPKSTYTEKFADAKGVRVVSRGLLQLSIESCRGYGIKLKDAQELHDPETNIRATVVIMNKWIVQDKVISRVVNGKHLGAGRYWSVIRPGPTHHLKEIQSKTLAVNYGGNKPMDKNAMRLAIIVGHDKKSKGAFSKTINLSEYDFNGGLANIAKEYATSKGVDCEVFLRDGVGISGAVKNAMKWKPDCIIEKHFNSFDGKATGTETLYSDSQDDSGIKEVMFAKIINDSMVSVLGLKDRGIKKLDGGGRGYGNLSVTKSVPSILIESFFGDNPKDAKAAINNKQKLAECIVDGFIKFMETVK